MLPFIFLVSDRFLLKCFLFYTNSRWRSELVDSEIQKTIAEFTHTFDYFKNLIYNSHVKMHQTVQFNVSSLFTELCFHPHNLSLEHFPTLEKIRNPSSVAQPNPCKSVFFLSLWICQFCTFHTNEIIGITLWRASFNHHISTLAVY